MATSASSRRERPRRCRKVTCLTRPGLTCEPPESKHDLTRGATTPVTPDPIDQRPMTAGAEPVVGSVLHVASHVRERVSVATVFTVPVGAPGSGNLDVIVGSFLVEDARSGVNDGDGVCSRCATSAVIHNPQRIEAISLRWELRPAGSQARNSTFVTL